MLSGQRVRPRPSVAPPGTAGRRFVALLLALLAVPGAVRATSAADPFQALGLMRPPRRPPAYAFTVPSPGGQPVRLADFRGRVVFVNFWATWCPPCRDEMPGMERLSRRFKDRGLVVLAISVDADGASAVVPFVREQGLTYPIGLDPAMAVAGRYGVRALPSSFLVDRHGHLVGSAVGPREWDSKDAEAVIESLLGGTQ